MSGWPRQRSFSSAAVAQLLRAARTDPAPPPRILILGDSNSGANPGDNGARAMAWSDRLQERLQAAGYDYQMVGPKFNLSAPTGPAGSWDGYHCGWPGYTIDELHTGRVADGTTGYAGWVADVGQPDIVVVSAGTNNFAATSAGSCLTKFSALLDTIRATSPDAWILVWSPPPSPTASPNNATRNTFVAGLGGASGIVAVSQVTGARDARFVYVDAGTRLEKALKLATDIPAYTHANEAGDIALGDALFDALVADVLGPPSGVFWERPFQKRTPQAVVSFGAGGATTSDYVIFPAGNTAVEPGAGSWAVGLDVYHASLPSGLHSIYQYGDAHPNTVLICSTTSGACTVYINGAPAMTAVPSVFRVGVWQSVLLHYDAANTTLSLWVDGKCVDVVFGQSFTPHAGENTLLGGSPDSGTPCIIGNVSQFFVATSGAATTVGVTFVPFGTGATGMRSLRLAAQAWHAGNVPLPGVSASYPLSDGSGAPASDIGGTAASALNGAAAWVAAGTIPRPWDVGADETIVEDVTGTGALSFTSGRHPVGSIAASSASVAGTMSAAQAAKLANYPTTPSTFLVNVATGLGVGAGARTLPLSLVGDVVTAISNLATGADLSGSFEGTITVNAQIQQTGGTLTGVSGIVSLKR